MSDTIKIEFNDGAAQVAFQRLADAGGDMAALMADVAKGLQYSTQDRFASKVAPDGTPWAPLAPGTLAARAGRGNGILWDTGELRDDIHAEFGPDYAEIGTGVPYAPYHQFGTAPFVILPSKKTALAFAGADGPIVRRRVNHPGLPARPFFGVSEEDEEMIVSKARKYLSRALDGDA